MAANPLAELIDTALLADPARPVLTFYDDATGERVELSGATTRNWVAKIVNLLVDGLDCQPGDRVGLLLPLHWQAAVLLLGTWTAGLSVTNDPTDADVIVAAGTALPVAAEAAPREILGLSLLPLGAPLPDVPPGVVDFATEVPLFGDVAQIRPLDGPAYDDRSGVDLAAAARTAAGHQPGERVLTVLPYTGAGGPDGVLHGLLAPLAAGGSVVLCRHADPAVLPSRVGTERVTATAGVDVPGVPRLA